MPLPPQWKSDEYQKCVFCGKDTRFRSVPGRPCCKECYAAVSDNLDKPITDGSDNDSGGSIPGWVIFAVVIIVLISLGIAKACSGPTLGNYQ